MSYCTEQHLINRYGRDELVQLTDRNGTGEIGTDTVAEAIALADSRIDGHCRGRFALPLSPVDEIIIGIACDLTRYRLYKDKAPEEITKRHDQAIADLKSISKGTIKLSAEALETNPTDVPYVESYDRVFSETTLEDY